MESNTTRRKVIQTLSVGGITIALSGCQAVLNDQDFIQMDSPMQTTNQTRQGATQTGRFTVTIDGVEVDGFQHVSIPSSSTEQGEYREGNDPDYEKKLWGQTTFDDLEMERGFIPGDAVIREWRDAILEGRVDDGRKDLAITLLDEQGTSLIEWKFFDAWIKEYDPPELDTSADGEVATESCTIAFDRMTREEM